MTKLIHCLPLAAVAWLSGCNLTGEKANNPGTSSSAQTTGGLAGIQNLSPAGQAATNSTVKAIQSMPSKVGDQLDPSTLSNLVSANQEFRSEVLANPSNSAASFGLATTSLALSMNRYSDSLNRMWNSGLKVGTDKPAQMFTARAATIQHDQVVAARALGQPQTSPSIEGLQQSLESTFMPTVDSVVSLLQTCWNDPNFAYRFKVDGFDDRDSLTIGRGDVGIALASAIAIQNYFHWLLAIDLEVGFSGQGFPSNYAWLDTLGNIDETVGPQTSFQNLAFQNLQQIVPGVGTSSTRNFLGTRLGHEAQLAAIPAKILSAADILTQAANYAKTYQTDETKGLVQLNQGALDKIVEAADTIRQGLSGPHTFVRPDYLKFDYVPSTCNYGSGSYNFTYTCYQPVERMYTGYSIQVDFAKAITLKDRKVFFPRFRWNTPSDWATKGPFSFLHGSTSIGVQELSDLDLNGPTEVGNYIEWTDPSFGGILPSFKTSADVFAKIEEVGNPKPVGSGSGSLLPRAVTF